ncbi:hypothetical protein [Aliarcobacter butzleri]|uniref:hypothetical protein n=1 Tax=Aliarcobacter butzleri TaxID=28197 RepID=UPI00125F3955|nr:hypothetical protein [Aliarcobacter butzleri]
MRIKLYLLFIIAFISFLVYGIINQKNYDPKVKRLACQNSITTFEKIYTKDLDFAKKLLVSSNYEIKSDIKYSNNMQSNLLGNFSTKQSDKILYEILNSFKSLDKKYDEKLTISYYIYENDKKDEGKKNKDAFSYAGYLVFEFKFREELLYKIQIDYLNTDTSDIKSRMKCVIESFLTI